MKKVGRNEFTDRVNLLIKYSLKESYDENLKKVNEQFTTSSMEDWEKEYGPKLDKASEEIYQSQRAVRAEKEKKEYDKNLAEYQQTCNAGEGSRFAVLPEPGQLNIKGYDGLPPGICAYMTPKIGNDGETPQASLILLKAEWRVVIIEDEVSRVDHMEHFYQQIEEAFGKGTTEEAEALKRLENRVPIGSLVGFYATSVNEDYEGDEDYEVQVGTYVGTFSSSACRPTFISKSNLSKSLPSINATYSDITQNPNTQELGRDWRTPPKNYVFYDPKIDRKTKEELNKKYGMEALSKQGKAQPCFKGYFLDGNVEYKFQELQFVDPRNTWDYLVDEFAGTAQLVAAAAFFVAGFFTKGATWLLWAEIALEGSLGVISAQRKIERGLYTQAGFDLLFGLTPWIKTAKWAGAVDNKALQEMFQDMGAAGLNRASTSTDVIRWYRNASPTVRQTFKLAMRNKSQFTENKMMEIWGEGYSRFLQFLKNHPRAIDNIRVTQNVVYNELGINGLLMGLDLLTTATVGRVLNDYEKNFIKGIHEDIVGWDKELASQFSDFLYAAGDKLPEALNDSDILKIPKILTSSAAEHFKKTLIQDSLNDVAIKKQFDFKSLSSETPQTAESIKALKKDGYVSEDDLTEDDYGNIYAGSDGKSFVEYKGKKYFRVKGKETLPQNKKTENQ